jgi:hypothetical protein
MYRISLMAIAISVLLSIQVAVAHASPLAGKIFLQVEDHGEAWYVNPATKTRYYLQTGNHAYQALSLFGIGISNADLSKIQVGVSSTLSIAHDDVDRDGLRDSMERALGTAINDADTDNDGYTDFIEVTTNHSPVGSGVTLIDQALSDRLRGYILLQVESHGEAWYVNPADGLRYYMEDGAAAYDLMRYMGIGITNATLATIAIDAASSLPSSDVWMRYQFATADNLSIALDLPSNSFVTNNASTDSSISATLLGGESLLTIFWHKGSKSPGDLLGPTLDTNRCLSATYGLLSGTECVGVTLGGMNAFLFESYGYTFMILDRNINRLGTFYGDDWFHVLSSLSVTL